MVSFPSRNYYHRETVEYHTKNIKDLLDLNFGKDWRVFMSLYYSVEYARHGFHYNNPHPIERTRFPARLVGVVRKAIFAMCMSIMKQYLEVGFEQVEQEIKEDKYRLKWAFGKGNAAQIIISDELYNAIHKDKVLNQESEEEDDREEKQDEEGKEEIEQTKTEERREKERLVEYLLSLWKEYEELRKKNKDSKELSPEDDARFRELKLEIQTVEEKVHSIRT